MRTSRLALYTGPVVITGLLLGPFGRLLLAGLKSSAELAASPVHWLPGHVQ